MFSCAQKSHIVSSPGPLHMLFLLLQRLLLALRNNPKFLNTVFKVLHNLPLSTSPAFLLSTPHFSLEISNHTVILSHS